MLLLTALLLTKATARSAAPSLTVDTEQGPVLGHYVGSGANQVREFLGIPFASPPVGDLRFAPPVPPSNRSSTYEANFMAPMCPQNVNVSAGQMGEDCLYLSIYTPASASAEPLPVYFWIYGGTFIFGAGAGYGSGTLEGMKLYNGYSLAPQGVIIVAINYRIGALGFLKSQAMVGNYGFSDQRMALQWVNDNIKNFGGDPSRITIGGQSAGAQSVLAHLASPLSQPLFAQAVMESAPIALPFHSNTTADKVAGVFAKYLGCSAGNLTCLREPDMATMLKAQAYAEENSFDVFDILKDYEAYNPTIDGTQLLNQPFYVLNSELPPSKTKPLLAGNNWNDALGFVYGMFADPVGYLETGLILDDIYDWDAGYVGATYPFSSPDGRVNLSRASTDMLFYCSLRNISRSAPWGGEGSAPVWMYRFDHSPSYRTDETAYKECYTKVCHSDELRFIFGNFTGPSGAIPITDFEASLSKTMQGYWLNFIKTGNPNSNPVTGVEWPQYSPADDTMLVFTDPVATRTAIEASQCDDLWDKIGYLRRHMSI